MKEETIAGHQANQVLPQSRKPKVLPKKEIPRLTKTEVKPKPAPATFPTGSAMGPSSPP